MDLPAAAARSTPVPGFPFDSGRRLREHTMSGDAQPEPSATGSAAVEGHHDLVGQPPTSAEGPIADAEARAAEISTDEHPWGTLGGTAFCRGDASS